MEMKQKEVLDKLRMAKSAHLGWVNRARSLLEGKPVDEDKVPVEHTRCQFAGWYYGEGQQLASLDSFQSIEEPHRQLHAVYGEIYQRITAAGKGSWLDRMTGKQERLRQQHEDQARILFQRLQHLSSIVIGKLDMLEKNVRRLTSEAPVELKQTHVERRGSIGLEINGEPVE